MRIDFYPRAIQNRLQTALADTPVVCLLGPRQSGKTTLARSLEHERAYITLDDAAVCQLANEDPDGFVQSLPDQVTLDEVQRAPGLLIAIKSAVDQERTPGRFLLTGSANLLLLPKVQDSLAGRMEVLHLHPLSMAELHQRPPTFLTTLLEGGFRTQIAETNPDVPALAGLLCKGGYPEPVQRSLVRARQWHRQYINAIIQRDVHDIANIHDEDTMARLIELLAYRTASLLNINNLAQELGAQRQTTEKYLSILERLFLIRRLPAWHRNHAKRLVKAPKIHIVDSGLAATLSKLAPDDWMTQSTAFGHLLESFVLQQIVCQASVLDEELRLTHYRDKDQVEVDIVIERGREVWGVEVKKASTVDRNKDGTGLKRLADRAGKDFKGGVLLYGGGYVLPVGADKCFACPVGKLWEG
ncbi:MAG: ATP-binding protein [Pseudomonadales bacterium]|nr:ATP-binding protein [Pseudomonadales bacterium]